MLDPFIIAVGLGILLFILLGVSTFSIYIYWRGIDLAPFFEKRERLKEEIESCQNTLSDLKAQMAEKNVELANANRTIAEGQSERKWLDENHDTVASLRDQIAHAKEDLKKAVDDRNEAEDKLKNINLEIQKAFGENQELSVANERFRKDNEEREKQKNDLLLDIKRLEEERSKAIHSSNEIQGELLKRRAELEKLNNDVQIQRDKLASLKQEIEEQKKKLNSLESEYKALQGNIRAKNEEIHQLDIACTAKKPANEEMKWGDLNRPVFDIKSAKVQHSKEEAWLERFKNSLKDNGIKFHDRMINAFHTGLKVADYSPLVVLAGISGTGKSLLPRLYAKAIGMNFLQIAVQPRWDNPQDMFGFYNYMDGRYKATELSRMLWQFDIFNNPQASGKYQKTLPMNLVLLDEMNLAKVEYYFSDMLSKLEVRRGINEKDEVSRRNAEVEIECGSTQKASEAKRLFVGRNTLFVGTMNEDESTQSLSDKVIDRSNVLRFGKPNDLAAKPDISRFENSFDHTLLIDWNTWQDNWLKKNSSQADKTNDIISRINNELASIGRPFAYRVFGAIQAYVNNYPGDDINSALADQIEMKVLPKLNGVDKESSSAVKRALDNIGSIIVELEDEELITAFNSAKDNSDEVFFQWRGVSR